MANNNSPFGLAPIKAEGSAISYDTDTMTFKTAGRYNIGATTNEAMRIDANGNIGIGTASNQASPLKVHGRPVEVKPFEVSPDMAMLEDSSSPYNVDVETLANLWVARFGKGWVGNDAVEDMDADQVDWWRHAANRLRELGYLEMHTLASSYRVVLRIVE